MPTLTKSVPSYRFHKASGQAVVTLDGRDHYLGPWQSRASYDAYDRLVAEYLANGRRLDRIRSTAISVEQLLAAFWKHAQNYYLGADGQPTKELDAYRQACKPLRRLYGAQPVVEFGPLALKAVRQQWIDMGNSRTHINHQVNRVRRMFKWGVENELVPPEVLQGLQAVAGLKRGRSAARETDPVKPVPEAYVDAIRPYVAPQVWTMVQLQLLTGMRAGEVTTMRGCDINTSGRVWEYRPTSHKTAYRGHERVVYLGPQAQEVLKPYLKTDLNAYLFSPQEAEAARNRLRRQNRETPMTPSQAARKPKSQPQRAKGACYTTGSYGRAIVYGIRKANVPHWHTHQLRHTAATRIRREFGLETAQIILGHKSADVTQVYAEVDHAKAVSVMASVG